MWNVVNYMVNGLERVMGFKGPEESTEVDETFLHQGKDIIVTLVAVNVVEKLVMRFSEEVGELAWKEYATLTEEEKEAVDAMEPDTRKGGKPKAKFANKYMLYLTHTPSGRNFYYEGEGWSRSDIAFFTEENDTPWAAFKKFLETLGPEITGPFQLGEYLHEGDEFMARLILKDGYLHLDPATFVSVNIPD
jgi:hypothetical protein